MPSFHRHQKAESCNFHDHAVALIVDRLASEFSHVDRDAIQRIIEEIIADLVPEEVGDSILIEARKRLRVLTP